MGVTVVIAALVRLTELRASLARSYQPTDARVRDGGGVFYGDLTEINKSLRTISRNEEVSG